MQIFKYVTIQATIPIACDNATIDYDNAQVLHDLAFRAICEDPQYVARMLSIVSHETVVNDSDHMTEVWEWAAKILANHASETMDLHEVESLSVEAATVLARFKGGQLILSGLAHVDDNVAAVLSSYGGVLVLSGIKTLSGQAAEALGSRVGDLDLSGLTHLTERAAAGLSRLRGWLWLDGLPQISDTAATLLAKRDAGLSLAGLLTVSPQVADAIVQASHDEVIDLSALPEISTDVAEILGRYPAGVNLDGLSSVSHEVAVALTLQEKGCLSLAGVKAISDSVAEALSLSKGTLVLDGISHLTDKAAYALAGHRGWLSLRGLVDITEKAADALRHHPDITLPKPLRKHGHTQRSRIRNLMLSRDENACLLGLQLYDQLPAASKDDEYVLCESAVDNLRGWAHRWLNKDDDQADAYALYRRVVVTPRYLSGHEGCVALVPIPAGSFTMGSPEAELGRGDDENQVPVQITSPFLLSRTVITVGQWQAVMGTEPWNTVPVEGLNGDHDDCPACCLTWYDAVRFCSMLTQLERLRGSIGEHQVFRLPTEAEWEYACRAGTVTAYSFGDDPSKLAEYAWCQDPHQGGNSIHRVGWKKLNPWGLADMHGNISEWCADWYAPRLDGGINPTGPVEGTERVCRGGGRTSQASDCRSASRERYAPNFLSYIGFRVLQTV